MQKEMVLQSLKDEEEDGVNITPFITGMCIAHNENKLSRLEEELKKM